MDQQGAHFQTNLSQPLHDLRSSQILFDVSLVCDDGKRLDAHKVILSAGSAVFKEMLTRNLHPYPLIFMTDISSDELEKILDFIYVGEMAVEGENVAEFIKLAQKLKVVGLQGSFVDNRELELVKSDLVKLR